MDVSHTVTAIYSRISMIRISRAHKKYSCQKKFVSPKTNQVIRIIWNSYHRIQTNAYLFGADGIYLWPYGTTQSRLRQLHVARRWCVTTGGADVISNVRAAFSAWGCGCGWCICILQSGVGKCLRHPQYCKLPKMYSGQESLQTRITEILLYVWQQLCVRNFTRYWM